MPIAQAAGQSLWLYFRVYNLITHLFHVRVSQAVTKHKTPSFPTQRNDELTIVQDMLVSLCQQCWATRPALRPRMHVVVGDLRPEALLLQGLQDSMQLVRSDVSNLETAS